MPIGSCCQVDLRLRKRNGGINVTVVQVLEVKFDQQRKVEFVKSLMLI
jgi:hypothetical protein